MNDHQVPLTLKSCDSDFSLGMYDSSALTCLVLLASRLFTHWLDKFWGNHLSDQRQKWGNLCFGGRGSVEALNRDGKCPYGGLGMLADALTAYDTCRCRAPAPRTHSEGAEVRRGATTHVHVQRNLHTWDQIQLPSEQLPSQTKTRRNAHVLKYLALLHVAESEGSGDGGGDKGGGVSDACGPSITDIRAHQGCSLWLTYGQQ